MTAPTVALVTAVYGGYDAVRPAPPGFDDCVLVTDQRVHGSFRPRGWRVVVLPRPGTSPRLAAKMPKCRPDWFTECESSVWVDGSFRILGDGLARVAQEQLAGAPLVVAEHPYGRQCLYDEATFCALTVKSAREPVMDQAEHYLSSGMPRNWGLWALGLIARRHEDHVAELGHSWLRELEQWSDRDQISLPFLLWQRRWRPEVWPFPQLQNAYVRREGHRKQRDWG